MAGRQELNAELLEDTPGALWNNGIIDAARQAAAPNLARIVVAIDPAAKADETGIVVVGKDTKVTAICWEIGCRRSDVVDNPMSSTIRCRRRSDVSTRSDVSAKSDVSNIDIPRIASSKFGPSTRSDVSAKSDVSNIRCPENRLVEIRSLDEIGCLGEIRCLEDPMPRRSDVPKIDLSIRPFERNSSAFL